MCVESMLRLCTYTIVVGSSGIRTHGFVTVAQRSHAVARYFINVCPTYEPGAASTHLFGHTDAMRNKNKLANTVTPCYA